MIMLSGSPTSGRGAGMMILSEAQTSDRGAGMVKLSGVPITGRGAPVKSKNCMGTNSYFEAKTTHKNVLLTPCLYVCLPR